MFRIVSHNSIQDHRQSCITIGVLSGTMNVFQEAIYAKKNELFVLYWCSFLIKILAQRNIEQIMVHSLWRYTYCVSYELEMGSKMCSAVYKTMLLCLSFVVIG